MESNLSTRAPQGLCVGLTGGLGSGKSTAAAMLATHGAIIFSADELARTLMQPGQPVFAAIVQHFGSEVLREDGTLDRPALARLAFTAGRVEELNAIIHPATIALQAKLTADVFSRQPNAIVVVESALIFESKHSAESRHSAESKHTAPQATPTQPLRRPTRFDRLILVTAPDALKVARFITRSRAAGPAASEDLAAEARRRLARMIPDEKKIPFCDFVLKNDSTLIHLQQQVDALWNSLTLKR